jgi:nucleotide-binding universal stress UspA family protein
MSIFPTKMLVATDGSRDAGVAATTAVGLAKATDSELHMVTVAEEYPHYEAYCSLAERSRQVAQGVLDKQRREIENLGGKVARSHLRTGTAAEEVVSLAEEIGAGLVVMGSRGRGRIRRLAMGSVSHSLVRHAHCPVMVVREEAVSFPTRILLATDASEEAHLAAIAAADVAERTGSELHVAHIGEVRPVYHPERHGYLARYEELQERAQRLLDGQVDMIKSTGGTVARAHLRVGRPDEEIALLGEETGANLIVMGSRGLGGIRRALMGSISDSVVRHAHCPVLVVRPEKERV